VRWTGPEQKSSEVGIPRSIREAAGIEVGEEVRISAEGGKIIIEKARKDAS
jgi:bifunctional DNA-binding transcriptional regulator/antitoxin component of YhaV-PrlF toxin-antitoxin module